jgi:transcriptional regulator with XRE-family HTH domain
MEVAISHLQNRLAGRREALGMTYAALAARSGVSEPTVKRLLSGVGSDASVGNVLAIAAAMEMSIVLDQTDAEEARERQARAKAERIARMVQGTSGLEGQAVDPAAYRRLVDRTFHELMAGPPRRVWAE